MSGESSTTRTRVMVIIPSGVLLLTSYNTQLLPQFTFTLHIAGKINALLHEMSHVIFLNCDDWGSHSCPIRGRHGSASLLAH